MKKKFVEQGMPHITIWRMRIHAEYLSQKLHMLNLCNSHCFSTETMVAIELLIVAFYINCMSLFFLFYKSPTY
jgi:hypothetical protein